MLYEIYFSSTLSKSNVFLWEYNKEYIEGHSYTTPQYLCKRIKVGRREQYIHAMFTGHNSQ